MDVRNALIKPLVTEKSMSKVSEGRYAFAVTRYATKTEIKKAIEKTFNVTVARLATSVMKGKTKRVGVRRVEVDDTVWKKAIVTVKKGERIAIFESGGEA